MPEIKNQLEQKLESRGIVSYMAAAFLAFFVAGLTLWSWQDDTLAEGREVESLVVNFQPESVEWKKTDTDWEELTALDNLEVGVFLRTDADNGAEIVFQGKNILRLDVGTEVYFPRLDIGRDKIVAVELRKGQVWVNANNGIHFDLFSGQLWLSSGKAVFNMRDDDENYEVYVNRRMVEVNFLKDNWQIWEDDMDKISDNFWNNFGVAEGLNVKIRKSKISEKLEKLRYSKLVKEFPVAPFTMEDLEEDEWISGNREKDHKFREEFELERLRAIRVSGQAGISPDSVFYRIQELYYQLGEIFILTEERKEIFQGQQILAPLKEAEFLLANQQSEEALRKLDILGKNLLSSDIKENDELSQPVVMFLQDKLTELTWVLPGDDFYPLKEKIGEYLIELIEPKQAISFEFEQNQERLAATYDLLDRYDNVEAKRTLGEYQIALENILKGNEVDLKELKMDLVNARRLLLNLYWQTGQFYNVEDFGYLEQLEIKLLPLFDSVDDQLEERLTYINDRLKTLYRIAALIKVNQLDLDRGIDLGEKLIHESEDLRAGAKIEVAVSDYFDEKLSDFRVLFRFFDSPEFSALHGVYDAEAYAEYKEKEEKLAELSRFLAELKENAKGEKAKRPVLRETKEQAEAVVLKLFQENDISLATFAALPDTNFRLFLLGKAEVEGISFHGKFDRETELVYDLKVEGVEETFTTGIKLNNLVLVLKTLTGVGESGEGVIEEEEEEEEEEKVERTDLEERFVTVIMRQLEYYDLVVENKNVILVDIVKDLYRLEEVYKVDQPDIVFSGLFDLTRDKNKVTEVKVITEVGVQELEGRYNLEKLYPVVEEAYLAAQEYRKQLEEEIVEEFDMEEEIESVVR